MRETTLFPLGRIVATANASETLCMGDVGEGLKRHSKGDWGDLCEEDKRLNERALGDGEGTSWGRLMSAYSDREGTKFWIITEADRSVTTVLLPEDY